MPNRLVSFAEKYARPLIAGALLSSVLAAPATANPSGASVQSGQVTIGGGAGNMTVQQFTNRAIVNWQKFGVGVGESVQFLQPSQLSVILNRVVGQDPTKILGQMNANGNVWIVNPNGVLFGPQSQVNVGGLVASTLNITNEDFLNGNYRFTQDQNKALASVVNQGSITITDGGYAVLMAPLVSNEGMIVANLGQVNLMSGESATLNFDGRNLISYDIGHMDSADPGTVVVDRSTVSALLANVIQDPNLTEAGEIVENPDGSVSLVGAAETVVNRGTIQANGAEGQKAGKVVLDSGRLTVLGEGSKIEASGQGADSDGGEVLALSHGTMKFSEGASLEAKGGDISGDGGFIDTSGYERIILEDYADASATDGERGQWLIDPDNLTIIDDVDGNGDLDGSTNTSGQGGVDSTISVGYLEGLPGFTTVTLQANNQITIEDLGGDETINFNNLVFVNFQADTGDIVFVDPNDAISVGMLGQLSMESGGDIVLGKLLAENGTIDLTAAGNITASLDGVDDIVGTVNIDTGGNFQADVSGTLNATNVQGNLTVRNNNGLSLDPRFTSGSVGGDLSVDNDNSLSIGNLNVTGSATITNSGDVSPSVGGTSANLVADSLTVNTDAESTSFELNVDVSSIVLDDDDIGAGLGSFTIANTDELDSLTVYSNRSSFTVGTTNTGGDVVLVGSELSSTTSGIDLGEFILSESGGSDLDVSDTTLDNSRGTNVSISVLQGTLSGFGTLTTLGDASFYAEEVISVTTDVGGILSATSQTGQILIEDSNSSGPEALILNTVSGEDVFVTLGGIFLDITDVSGVLFDSATSTLTILDQKATDTDVTFTTGTGDINVDFVDVGHFAGGDLNDVNLIATTGSILDSGDPGLTDSTTFVSGVTNPDLDIRAGNVTLVAGGSIGTTTDTLELDTGNSISTISGGDTVLENITTSAVSIAGMTSGGTIDLTHAGDLNVNADIESTGGNVAILTTGDVTIGDDSGGTVDADTESIIANGTVSIETTGGLINDNNGPVDAEASIQADTVILRAINGIGADGDELTIAANTLAAFTTGFGSTLDIVDVAGDLTVGSGVTLKGGSTVTGVFGHTGVSLDVQGGGLLLNQPVSASTGNVAVKALGDIDFDNKNDRIFGHSKASIESVNGGIINTVNDGVDDVSTITSSGRLVIRVADEVASAANPLEVQAASLAVQTTSADSDGIFIEDLTESLTVTTLTLDNGSGTVTGVQTAGDVSLESNLGSIVIDQEIASTNGNVALKSFDGVEIRNDVSAGNTISIETDDDIRDFSSTDGVLTATNVVLDSENGIDGVQVDASNLAATSRTGDTNIEATNSSGTEVTVTRLNTLKDGERITGIDSAEDLELQIDGDNLQISRDVTSQTGTIYLQADGDITIGDGNGDQVTGTSKVVLEAGGNISDNNGADTAAADVMNEDLILVAGGSIEGAGGSAFEIDALDLAASAGSTGNINILDVGTFDGLGLETLRYTDTEGNLNSVSGVSAGEDIYVELLSYEILVIGGANSTNGNVALHAQDSGGYIDISGDIFAAGTLSLEADEIRDTSSTNSIQATDIVIDAVDGIGNSLVPLAVQTENLAVRNTTSGEVHVTASNPSGSTISIVELTTLQSGEIITGIQASGDLFLEVNDDLNVNENIVAGGSSLAILADGDIQLGDAIGTTRGVLVAGVGTDGAIGGGDDVTATVSLESGGQITDGNGDDTIDGDGDSLADGANIIALGDGTLDTGGNVVLRVASAIGGGDSIELDTLVAAATSTMGSLRLSEQDLVTNDGLTIGELTTSKGGIAVTGVSNDFGLSVETTGDLRINEDVTSDFGQIYLSATGDITVGNDPTAVGSDADQVAPSGSASVVLEADGDIIDNNGSGNAAIGSSTVGLISGGSIGDLQFRDALPATGSAFELNNASIAAVAGGDINILSDGVGLGSSLISFTDPTGTSRSLEGVSAGLDLSLENARGTVAVLSEVSSTNGSVSLKALDDVRLGDGVTAVGTISIEAGDEIFDPFSDTPILSAMNVVFDAENGIGSGQALVVNASNLAAISRTGGDIDIEVTNPSGTDVTISEFSTLTSGNLVTGVSSANDVCLDVTGGDGLQLNEDVVGGTAGAASEIALRADGNIVIGDGAADGNHVRHATADTGNLISLFSANGNIEDNNGDGVAAVDANGGDTVMSAANGTIGSFDGLGTDTSFELNAGRLAATSGDDLSIADLDTNGDGLDLTTLTLAKGDGDVSGLTAGNDICLDLIGSFIVDENIISGGNLALRSDGAIQLGATTGATRGVLVAGVGADGAVGGGDDETATVSVEAGGSLTNGNGSSTVDGDGDGFADGVNIVALGNGTTESGGNVVLKAGGTVGTDGGSGPIELDTLVVAASAGSGPLNLSEQDLLTDDGLTIGELSTLKGASVVTGATTPGNLTKISVSNGSLDVQENVLSVADIELSASEDIIVGSTINGGNGLDDVLLTAQNGDIISDGGDIDAFNLYLSAGQNIGVDSSGDALPLTFTANSLAVRAGLDVNLSTSNIVRISSVGSVSGIQGGGSLDLTSTSGPVFIDQAIRMSGDICLDLSSDLYVSDDISSDAAGIVAIRTGGDVRLSGGSGDTISSTGGVISIEAGGAIVDGNGANLDLDAEGGLVVLKADEGIGESVAGEEITIKTSQLAASAAVGDVALINDGSGGLIITEADTAKGGVAVTGLSASDNIDIDVVDGTLSIDRAVQADGDIFLEADNIHIGADIIGGTDSTDQVGVTARSGRIGQTGGSVQGYNVALSATDEIGRNIGLGDTVLGIDATNLAASAGGYIRIEKLGGGDLTIAENLNLKSGTVSGLQAGEYLDLTTDGALTVDSGIMSVEDLCLDITGDLTINEGIESTTGDIAIRTGGDALLGDDSGDTVNSNGGTISIESDGSLTDRNGTSLDLDADGGLIVITADGGIGDTSSGGEIEIEAGQLAASSGGEIAVEDYDSGGLQIVEATTLKGDMNVSGLESADDLYLNLLHDLTVEENIISGGDLSVRSAFGSIQLGDSTGTTSGVLVAGVGADGAVGGGDDVTATVSLEAGGDITDGNGDETADLDGDGFADGANIIALGDGAVQTGGNIVLQASAIGSSGASNDALEIDTQTLAASTEFSDINLVEQDLVTNDGLTIGTLSTLLGGSTVTGIDAAGDICIDVEAGSLDIQARVLAENDDIFLEAAENVIIAADVEVDDSMGITSENGSIINAGGILTGGRLALSAAEDIGVDDSGVATPLELRASNLAVSAGDNIYLEITKTSTLGVSGSQDLKTGSITGISGNGELILATDGNLSVDEDIRMTGDIVLDLGGRMYLQADVESTGGNNIAIRTSGEVFLGKGADDTITTQGGIISIEANSSPSADYSINDRNGDNLDLDAGDGLIVVRASGEVGGRGSTKDLEIAASQLAAQSMDGDVAVKRIGSGDLEVT